MAMQDPSHPGGIVRRQCLARLGLSVTAAARGLDITREALSELVNEKTGVSVDMAIRLSKAFGSSPETWLGMQMACDLCRPRRYCSDRCKERGAARHSTLAEPVRSPTLAQAIAEAQDHVARLQERLRAAPARNKAHWEHRAAKAMQHLRTLLGHRTRSDAERMVR